MQHTALVPRIAAAILLALSTISHAATTIPGDVTGLWFDALHPGWGVNVVQQDNAAVATVFTYDASGAPAWYVASRLEANGIEFDPCGTLSLTGTLYRTHWPSFGSASNPSGTVQAQAVGLFSMSIHTVAVPPSSAACNRNVAGLQYSIDGVATTVSVTRETWASNQAKLYGSFGAGLVFPAATPPCIDATSLLPAGGRQLSITGAPGTSSASEVTLVWGTGIDTACQIRGTYSQAGQFGTIAGTLSCGPIGSGGGAPAPVRVSRLYAGDSGFVGEVSLDLNSCIFVGAIAAARRP